MTTPKHVEYSGEEPTNGFFFAWARLILGHRALFLLLSLLFTAAGFYLIATRLRVDTTVESFANTATESQHVLEEYRDEFGRDDMFLILIKGDVFSIEYLNRLKALHDELAALDMDLESIGERKSERDAKRIGAAATPKQAQAPPKEAADDEWGEDDEGWGDEAGGTIIDEITSLINARRTRSQPDGLEVGELMDPFPTADQLPALKTEVLADPVLVGQVIDAKAHYSVILIRAQFMAEEDSKTVNNEIKRIIDAHEAEGFETSLSGLPAMDSALNALMMSDLQTMLKLSVLFMIIVLLVLFRHPLGIIPPLVVVAMAASNIFGLMALLGMPVTMLSNILPAFLFCVGLGDSVHLLSVYRDRMKQGHVSKEAMIYAIGTTGLPIFFTSITTMFGLLSFQFATLTAIQQMGIAGAFGVFMAFIHSLVFLPIVVSFNKKSLLGAQERGRRDFIDRFLGFCLRFSGQEDDTGVGPEPAIARTHRRRAILFGIVLMGTAIFGTSLLRVWHNPLSWMPPEIETKQAFDEMDTHMGGTASVQLLLDAQPGKDIKNKAFFDGLEALDAHIRAYTHPEYGKIIGNSISVLDVVKETNKALHGGDPAYYKIPDTDRGISDILFMFESAGPDQLRRLVTNDLQRTQMSIRIKWIEATSYEPLTEHIEAGIKQFIPKGAVARPTGSVYTLVSTIATLIWDLLRSFTVAFLVITLVMILLLRSVKLGLIAMIPNLMPIAFVMGIMGFSGIPIDMSNLLIASIAMGIAVDDTIHFLHHFRLKFSQNKNVEAALRASMQHSGRAMVSTTVILALGFFAYLGATMYNIQRFGMLIGLTAIMALLIDLVFTPALLRTFYSRPTKEEGT